MNSLADRKSRLTQTGGLGSQSSSEDFGPERYQIWLYFTALAVGAGWGWGQGEAARELEPWIAIALGLLLYIFVAFLVLDTWSVVVTIVVLQPLVELTGMIGYLWWVPQRLLKNPAP